MAARIVRGPRHWASRIASGAVMLAMLILVALALALVVVPRAMGGMSLTVLTGSMEPGIHPGDIVVTKGITAATVDELQPGDVISFLPFPDDPTLVTHRIVSKSVGTDGPQFVTKGDNNPSVDPWGPMTSTQIRGKLLFAVPKLGYLRESTGGNLGTIVVAAAVILIGYGAIAVFSSIRNPRNPRRAYDPKPGDGSPDRETGDGSSGRETGDGSSGPPTNRDY